MSQPTLSEHVGIAGSGAVACGIARLVAGRGEVILWARSEASAERARGCMTDGDWTVSTELDDLAETTIVIEAVAEDAAIKGELLGRLGALLPAPALLATTTSSLSVAELAGASGRADRFAGLHVFNPADKMKLIELVYPKEAGEETRARIGALCEALGRTALEVPDIPGFVVNRLLFPYLFSAVELMDGEGVEAQTVDACLTLGAGHPMGPLALLDFVGLDVATAIGEAIGTDVPERLRALVEQGKLGRKTGAGFFEYD